jgi:hypothetical protein
MKIHCSPVFSDKRQDESGGSLGRTFSRSADMAEHYDEPCQVQIRNRTSCEVNTGGWRRIQMFVLIITQILSRSKHINQ